MNDDLPWLGVRTIARAVAAKRLSSFEIVRALLWRCRPQADLRPR